MIRADAELRYLKGVGPRRGEALAEQGVERLEDLLYVLPFRWEDRSSFAGVGQLRENAAPVTLSVKIEAPRLIRTRKRGFSIFQAQAVDESGAIRVVWYNQPYLQRVMTAERKVLLFGRATRNRYRDLVLENPEYELPDDEDGEGVHTGRLVPVYRKLADLNSRALRGLIFRGLEQLEPDSLEPLVPTEIQSRYALADRHAALRAVHFPPPGTSEEDLLEGRTPAQRSLAFEEIFLLQLALALRRHGVRHEARGIAYRTTDALKTRLGRMLPFKLTGAQKRVLGEIGADLRSDHPMHRLLQGDVGSGKTIVALLALLVAVDNGYQGALMAPTEILAEQHHRNIEAFLSGGEIDCPVELLTGSVRAAERRRALARIADGQARLAVGTHALFEGGVEFERLGLAVIDEQHRFGVLQRAALADKGTHPDVLVMTATPIPRSLALTLYGDLDLSVIDELPPGRTPIATVVRTEAERPRVYRGLRRELDAGRQAYVVVPLVEETRRSDLKAADAFARALAAGELSAYRVGMLHGKMKAAAKEAVMTSFREGRTQVLVSTTVIEVGVDVPNATVMIVEHAERFGLSQLHQLRGRVGRGSRRSYCVLMSGAAQGKEAGARLGVMVETGDGFRIAERDLSLRGPGAVFGTQQHGLSDMRFLAEVLRAPALLENARTEAQAMIAREAGRERARAILDGLKGRWRKRLQLARVG